MSSPAESQTHSQQEDATSVEHRVARCAFEATNEAEFLQRIAAEMAEAFGAGIVALASPHWASPLMLVVNQSLSQQVDRSAIRELLASASPTPIACDIPVHIEDQSANTRALRVEIEESPRKSAVLLVFDSQQQFTPGEQVSSLKQLNEFAGAAREHLENSDHRGADYVSEHELASHPIGDEIARFAAAEMSTVGARQSLAEFHRNLDLNATAFRIANESRRLLGCDRVTVLTKRGPRKYTVSAISGVSVVDKRSNSVKAIERLSASASVMARPLILPCDDPLPPQIQTPLDEYLDETGVMTGILLPLYDPTQSTSESNERDSSFHGEGDVIAMLMLEYFEGEVPADVQPSAMIVSTEASFALRNAMEHQQVFGLSVWKSVGEVTKSGRLPYLTLGLIALIGLITAMAFVQTEHHVVATGTVEPSQQRQVFANVDGTVKTIYVIDGQEVTAGTPLLQLENADLESRAESLTGEIQTATNRLTSIQTLRLTSDGDASQADRLVLEERQLSSELENLREQQALVNRQQAELKVLSPIDGTVVAWQIERRLSDRPVSRGNLLLRVVNHEGPWSLRLNIPDYRAGAVVEAFDASQPLPVKFAVATDPDASFSAELQSLATAARLDETGQHVIDASADVLFESESGELPVPTLVSASVDGLHDDSELVSQIAPDGSPATPVGVRVGADVTARIACGSRSVLRSWFGDVFDFVDRNVMFYFR